MTRKKRENLALVERPAHRPRLYETHEAFEAKVEEYFESEDGQAFPTMTGISLHMGFSNRDSFANYAEYGEDFSSTVNKARMRIENHRHKHLIQKDTFTPGIIFDLKNNHGWKDKTEVELTGDFAGILAQRRKKHA
jgi:hypothetical protein